MWFGHKWRVELLSADVILRNRTYHVQLLCSFSWSGDWLSGTNRLCRLNVFQFYKMTKNYQHQTHQWRSSSSSKHKIKPVDWKIARNVHTHYIIIMVITINNTINKANKLQLNKTNKPPRQVCTTFIRIKWQKCREISSHLQFCPSYSSHMIVMMCSVVVGSKAHLFKSVTTGSQLLLARSSLYHRIQQFMQNDIQLNRLN